MAAAVINLCRSYLLLTSRSGAALIEVSPPDRARTVQITLGRKYLPHRIVTRVCVGSSDGFIALDRTNSGGMRQAERGETTQLLLIEFNEFVC